MINSIVSSITFISCSVVLLIASSCKSSDQAPANVPKDLRLLYNEIMAIHDEVMPKMNGITQLQSQLSVHLDSLRTGEPLDLEKIKETNQYLGQLNRAESAMWDWMHGFADFDSIPVPEKESFLNNQKSSVLEMKNLVLGSIDSAQNYMRRYERLKEN